MKGKSIVIGLVFLFFATIAGAQLIVPNTFADGDVISAAEMNENFDALEAALTSLTPKIYTVIPTTWGNTTTSSSFVEVTDLTKTIVLDRTSTVAVLINGHAIATSGSAALVRPFANGTTMEADGYGGGLSHSTAWTSMTAIGTASLGAGTHTIDARFRSAGPGSVSFNGGALIILVIPQ